MTSWRVANTPLGSLLGERPGIFLICLFVWTLSNVDQALFGYALPGILAEFHLPLSAAGVVLAISFGATAVLVILSSAIADRRGRGMMVGLLLLSSALAVGMQGFATGITTLTVYRAIGFGLSGGLSPLTNALVVENSISRYRGVAMGLLQCGYPLGWFVASFAAVPLLADYGWRAVCFIAFIIAPLALPIAWFIARSGIDASRNGAAFTHVNANRPVNPVAIVLSAAHRRVSCASMAMFFLFAGAYGGSVFFFPSFFTQTRGYTAAEAASIVGLANGIAVFGYLGAALVGEFIMTRRTVFIVWCLGGALALAGLLWLSHTRTADILWYGATAALFFGSQAVAAVFVAELYPAAIRATALGMCVSAPICLGLALFPLIVPHVVSSLGWRSGLTAVVLPLLIGSALSALLLPNRPSGQLIL